MCKIFPEYVTGSANEWFNEFPRGSISSFRDLPSKFYIFFQQARALRSSNNILNMKQRKDKSFND